MNSKQFIAITTGTAIVSGIVGKLIGNKTCKEKMNYYKETSIKLFHSLEIKEEELNRLKQANKDVEFYFVKNADHGGAVFFDKAAVEVYDQFICKCLNKK